MDTTGYLQELKDQWEKDRPKPCPNCGACPTCGRGSGITYIPSPWYPPATGPIWTLNTNVRY